MKQLRRITIIVFCFFMILFCGNIYANETQQDGLKISLTTNKEEYKINEKIDVDLSIMNESNHSIYLQEVENLIPSGFTLDKKSLSKLQDTDINVGETIHLQSTFEVNDSTLINSNNSVDTGDKTKFIPLFTLLGISSIVIISLIKFRNLKKMLLILISLGLISTVLYDGNIKATESNKILHIKEVVNYNGNNINLESIISYENSSYEPKDPVIYQDGVKETYLEYELDENMKTVIIYEENIVSNWKIDEVHVLKSETDSKDDIAIRIDSINKTENGNVIISYTPPELAEVIKQIDYSGIESQAGKIIPADGVTFGGESLSRSNTNSLYSAKMNSFDLFKKHNFAYEKDGYELNGELCIEKINYDFDIKCNWFNVDINKIFLTLDASLSLGLDMKDDFGGERKIKLATYEAPLAYGFFAVGDIYCYVSANGELSLEYTIEATCGLDYTKGEFKGVWELQGQLEEAKANVNLKVGSTVEPKISFLKIGLIGGEFDYGRDYELNLDEISISPTEYCLEAGYHNYANVSAVLLPGSWNKKITATLMNKDNSHINEYLHFEETGIVSECTRKFGSLEGVVLKQEGSENLPLISADIILEKNGKEIYKTKSGSNGKFSFGKEIEKGTYDIIVKSKRYETYRGSIKIIGNKKNVANDIILKPEAKTVVVSGKVYNAASKEPINNAKVSVKGYVDRSTTTDYDGNYSLEVPIGNQEITVNAKGYAVDSISKEFVSNTESINFALRRVYDYEVLTINAGESYQFDFSSNKGIVVRANEATEYSSYLDGNSTYHIKGYTGEFYRSAEKGSHWEIKVYSGSLTIFANDGGFYENPDSNLSDVCVYSSLNGVDPFKDFTLTAGQSITLDNQADGPKNEDYVFHTQSYQEVTGTETVTDYYWNTKFGWDITENIYDLKGVVQYWRPINTLEKVKISITSGKAVVYFYRLDPITVY